MGDFKNPLQWTNWQLELMSFEAGEREGVDRTREEREEDAKFHVEKWGQFEEVEKGCGG